MPVRKFRSVEEIPETWYTPGDPALYRAIAAVWSLGRKTLGARFPPGVYKHRSIEDMNRLQEAWDQANFEAFQARQAREKALLEERSSTNASTKKR